MADNQVGGVNLELTAEASSFRSELDQSAAKVVQFVEAAAARFGWLATTMTGVMDGPISGAFGNFATASETFQQVIARLNRELGIFQKTADEYRTDVEAIVTALDEASGVLSTTSAEFSQLDSRVLSTMRSMNILTDSVSQTGEAFITMSAAEQNVVDITEEVVAAIKHEDNALLKLAGSVQRNLADQERASARNVEIVRKSEDERYNARKSSEAKSLEATRISDAERIASEERTVAKIIELESVADEARIRRGLKGDLSRNVSAGKNRISGLQGQLDGATPDETEAIKSAISSEQAAITEANIVRRGLDQQSQARARYARSTVATERNAAAEIAKINEQAAANEERITTETNLRRNRLESTFAAARERIIRETEARNAEINAQAATKGEIARKAAQSSILSNTAIADSRIATMTQELADKLAALEDETWIAKAQRAEVGAARIEAINNNLKKTLASAEELYQSEIRSIEDLSDAEREAAYSAHQARLNRISREAAAERLRVAQAEQDRIAEVQARIDAIAAAGSNTTNRRDALSSANATATTSTGRIAGLRQNLAGAGIQERAVINQRISAETQTLQEAQLDAKLITDKLKAEATFATEQQRIRALSAKISAAEVRDITLAAEARLQQELAGIDENGAREREAIAAAHAARLVGIEERRIREMNELSARSATPSIFGSGAIVDAYSPLSRFARQFSMARESANTMMTAGGVGLLPVLGSVMASADVTNSLYKSRGNTEMSDADFAEMKNMVMNRRTNQTPESQSRAYMEAEVFDFKGKDASKIVEAATPAAVSTFTDLDKVTEALAHVMHIFNIQVSEAPKVLNAMEVAAARSNMTFEEFVLKMGRAFQTAAAMGIPLTQASAILSTFAKNGMTASQSATAFRSIVTGIINPSKESQKWIKHLSDTTGIDLVKAFSAAGVAHYGLTGVLDMVARATGNSNDKLKHLFADQRNFIPTIELLTHAHKDLVSTVNDETLQIAKNDRVQKNAAAVQATFSYQMQALWQNVIRLAAGFGDSLAPQVKIVSEWLNKLVDNFKALPPETKALIADTTVLGSLFLLLGGAALAVVARIPQLIEGFTVLKTIFGGASAAAAGAEAAATGAAAAGATAGAGLTTAFAPIAAILVLVALAVKAFSTAWKEDWGQIREYAAGVADTLHRIFTIVQQTVADVTKVINDQWADMAPEAKSSFELVLKVIKSVVDTLNLMLIAGLGGAKQLIIGFVETVGSVIKLLVRIIGNVIQLVKDLIDMKWKDAWDDAKKLVNDALDDIGHAILGLWDGIAGGIGAVLKSFASFGSSIGESIKNGFFAADVDGAIKKALDDAAQTARNTQTDLKPMDPFDPKMMGMNHTPSNWSAQKKLDMYDPIFKTVSERTGVPIEVLKTIMHNETGGGVEGRTATNKNKNGTTDYGLMQINSSTKNPSTYDWKDPYQNIMAGALVFKAKQDAADKHGEGLQGAFRRYNGSGPKAEAYARRSMDFLKTQAGSWQFSFGPPPTAQEDLPPKPKKAPSGVPHPKDVDYSQPVKVPGLPGDLYIPPRGGISDQEALKLTVNSTNYHRILQAINSTGEQRLEQLGTEAKQIDIVTAKLAIAQQKQDVYKKASLVLDPTGEASDKAEKLLEAQAELDRRGRLLQASRDALAAAQKDRDKAFTATHHAGRTDEDNKLRSSTQAHLNDLLTKNSGLTKQFEAQGKIVRDLTTDYRKHSEAAAQLTAQANQEAVAIKALQTQRNKLLDQGPASDLRYVQANMNAGLYTHQQYQDRLKGMMTGVAVSGGMQQEDVEGRNPTDILARLKSGSDSMRAAAADYERIMNVYTAEVLKTNKASDAAIKANKAAFEGNINTGIKRAKNDLDAGVITFDDYSQIMEHGMTKVAEAALGSAAIAGKSFVELKTMMIGADVSLSKEFESMYSAYNTQKDKHDKAEKKAADNYLKIWKDVTKSAADAIATNLDAILHKHQSIGKSIQNIWKSIIDTAIKKKLEDVSQSWAESLSKVFDRRHHDVTPPAGHDTETKTIMDSMKDLKDTDVLQTKVEVDLTKGIVDNTNALGMTIDALKGLTDAFVTMMTSGTGGYDNVGSWQDGGTTTTGNTATGDNAQTTTTDGKTKSNDKSAADVQSAANAVGAAASANASTATQIASLGNSVSQISRDPGVGRDVNFVATLAKPGGPKLTDAPALAADAGMSGAVPWIAAAVAVVGLISALGAQKKPDYETHFGDTKYNTLTGTDFTAMASDGPSGPDGMRALLGNYQSIRNQKAGNTVHHVEIQPGSIQVSIQGVDPSNSKQVAGMIAGHVQDIIERNNTLDHATRGTV